MTAAPAGAALGLILALLLGGCFRQPLPDLSRLPDQPPDFPLARYQGLAAEGWTLLRLDPSRSEVSIYVFRAGRMARLGHNHVISASRIGGLAARNGDRFLADLYLPVADLQVDPEGLRAAAGPDFQSELSDEDKADTRANMLSEELLDAPRHPFLTATLVDTRLAPGETRLTVALGIRETLQVLAVPMEIELSDGAVATGRFPLRQTAFGLEPFSILGGAIAVADELEIEFRLAFEPVPADRQ